MHILLTGTESCGIDVVMRSLQAAGHEVFMCTEDVASASTCRAIGDPDRCPMGAGIDVIVAARQHPLPHLTAREQLVGCACLENVPLVVAGSTVINPFGAQATTCVEGFADVVGVVETLVDGSARATPAVLSASVPGT